MNSDDTVAKFAVGFIVGAVAGLAAALFLTPLSGREIREVLKEKAAYIPETIKEHTADREKVYRKAWQSHRGQHTIHESYFD